MLRKMGYLSSSSNFLWSFTPFAVAFSSFALFSTISGKPLTSDIVFPAITLFSLLGFPLAVLPIVFSSLVEAYVSIDRLTNFLCGKELQEGAIHVEIPKRELKDGDELVSVVHGEFSWTSTAVEPTLIDINLSLKVRSSSLLCTPPDPPRHAEGRTPRRRRPRRRWQVLPPLRPPRRNDQDGRERHRAGNGRVLQPAAVDHGGHRADQHHFRVRVGRRVL